MRRRRRRRRRQCLAGNPDTDPSNHRFTNADTDTDPQRDDGDSGFSTQAGSGPAPGEFVAYNELRFIAVAVSGKSAVIRLTR